MSDKVVINVRERPLSTDIMLAQLIAGRLLGDSLKYLLGSQFSEEVLFSDPARTLPATLAVGLNMFATTGASLVNVRSGALFVDSATVPNTPAANDTTYRIGLSRADTTVALPAGGGSNRWQMLVAVIQEVVAVSETRDIMDADTAHFEPTLVSKLTEFRIAFSWVTGAASANPLPTIPAVPAGAVPIGAVLQSGTGQVLSGSIIDLRPTLAKRPAGAHRQTYFSKPRAQITTFSTPDTRSWFARICVSEAYASCGSTAELGGGQKLHYGGIGASIPTADFSSTLFQEPGLTLTGSTWYYVYLAPWGDWAPGNTGATVDSAGVLVLSQFGPSESGFNANILNLPPPYGIYPCAAGRAQCVGIVRTNAQSTGLVPMHGQDSVFKFSADNVNSNRIGYDGTTTGIGNKVIFCAANQIPSNAKHIQIQIELMYSSSMPVPEFLILQGQNTGAVGFPARSVRTVYNGIVLGFENAVLDFPANPSTGITAQANFPPGSISYIGIMDVHVLEVRI